MIMVPLRTVPGNPRELWQARHRRVKNERKATAWMLTTATRPDLPCSVLLTRIAFSAGLDDDNLRTALKGVRDQIAEWLGVNDRDSVRVRYRYAQRRGTRGEWAVSIEFGPPVSGAHVLGVEVEDERSEA